MKYLSCLVLLVFLSFTNAQAFGQISVKSQTHLISGVSHSVFFKSGSTSPTNLKLSKGDLVKVQFVKFNVEIIYVNGENRQTLLSIQEDDSWSIIEVAEYDFEIDGNNEILVAKGDGFSLMQMYVFKKVGSQYKLIGEVSGEQNCIVSKNKITAPYGSQGLFFEYVLKNGKFIETE